MYMYMHTCINICEKVCCGAWLWLCRDGVCVFQHWKRDYCLRAMLVDGIARESGTYICLLLYIAIYRYILLHIAIHTHIYIYMHIHMYKMWELCVRPIICRWELHVPRPTQYYYLAPYHPWRIQPRWWARSLGMDGGAALVRRTFIAAKHVYKHVSACACIYVYTTISTCISTHTHIHLCECRMYTFVSSHMFLLEAAIHRQLGTHRTEHCAVVCTINRGGLCLPHAFWAPLHLARMAMDIYMHNSDSY